MVVPVAVVVAGPTEVASAASPFTCNGTSASPGVLAAGTYSAVTVSGVCYVDAGQVTVTGDVTIQANNSLISAFANSTAGPGTSGITVNGNVNVASGGTLVLGCEALHFPCFDDSGARPTLNSYDTVQGSINATSPLGVLVHDSTIGTDVTQTGGGGGVICAPSGIFAAPPVGPTPVYSDYEDNTIGGHLRVTGLQSCWFGAIRNKIGGSATFQNGTFADPDASENLTNQIAGNLCARATLPPSSTAIRAARRTPSAASPLGSAPSG
jgi:hypothetical protein